MKQILFLILFIFNVFAYAATGSGTVYYPQNADELNSTIAEIETGDVIELNSSVRYVLKESLPVIDTGLIINGNGAVIDGNKTYSVFYIGSNGDVSLDKVVVINANIYALSNNQGKVNISSCGFIDNKKIADDGIDGEYGNDGSDGENAYGGAIYNNGVLKIKNTEFINNFIQGGNGGNGSDNEEGEAGGNGGNGGNAYGAAIYNTSGATISLSAIRLNDSEAIAGEGGFGGLGGGRICYSWFH